LALLKLFATTEELADVKGWYRDGARDGQPFGYGHAKAYLAQSMDQYFAKARARREELLADPAEVDEILAASAAKARALAQQTIGDCKRACGLA
jgi:tryptophanyl-tRNA synthetase